MAPMCGAALAIALALLVGRAEAEVYEVTKEEAPSFTLVKKHLFYVGVLPASGHERDEAQVVFEDFHVLSGKLGSPEHLPSNLQVGLIPWEDFDQLVDTAAHCGSNNEVVLKDHKHKEDVRILKVPFGKTVAQEMKIATTGVYVAFLSNCGTWDDLEVSGVISVRGSSGFLPANREGSLASFCWCLALYIIAGCVWVAVLASDNGDLHEPHYAIASLITYGVVEALCYWQYLGTMVDTGQSWAVLEKLCQLMGVMKSAYTFVVIMLLCLGVGLTQTRDCSDIKWKLVGATTLFSAALAPKVCVFDYRHAKNLSDGSIILSVIPAVLATLGCTAWGLMSISNTMARCKVLNYDDTLAMLKKLVVFIVVLLIVAAGVLAAQVLDKPGRGAMWWQHHVFWSDVAGEILHFIALVFLMILCQPNHAVFKADTYAAVLDEGEMNGVPCAQEGGEQNGFLDVGEMQDEDKSPRADTIGALTSHAEE